MAKYGQQRLIKDKTKHVMRPIRMVDLPAQVEPIQEEINAAIAEVISAADFINGHQVKEFATQLAAFNRVATVVPCGNGTDALQIALMALQYTPGDEVIIPVFNYVATAEVVVLHNR